MTDGTSIFGVDTARYQPLGTYDRRDFEVVNFEDPQLVQKIADCIAAGKPWGVYLWIYPEHNVFVDAAHMVDAVRALGHGDPPGGYWFDYEDPGVGPTGQPINPGQLHDGFAALDAKNARGGYYSGPHALDHGGFLDRSWWNAAYPTGDVDFPGYGSLWASSRPRPMDLWQYTSGGGLDRDVVVDDAWWTDLTHGAPTPTPDPPKGDEVLYKEMHDDGTVTYWEPGFGDYVQVPDRVGKGAELNGVKAVPINTDERIALGVARRDQAKAFLVKLGLVKA